MLEKIGGRQDREIKIQHSLVMLSSETSVNKYMNNNHNANLIIGDDFRTFLFWKVWWKLAKSLWNLRRRKTFGGFCVQVIFLGLTVIFLSLTVTYLVGSTGGTRKINAPQKPRSVNKSPVGKQSTLPKAQIKTNKK